jgi:aspartokinase/homoserine dehydrogenase 1
MGKHPVYETKTTDLLLNLLPDAIASKPIGDSLELIYNRHVETMKEMLSPSEVTRLSDVIRKDIVGLQDILRAVTLIKGYDDRIEDLVAGHGELWSAQMLCSLLNHKGFNYTYLDARLVLKVVRDIRDPEILWETSSKLLNDFLTSSKAENLVITGFIASTMDGTFATLKRDGSDYSASIFGKLLKSNAIVIWTDVSGVLSADPRRVPEAKIIPEVRTSFSLYYYL